MHLEMYVVFDRSERRAYNVPCALSVLKHLLLLVLAHLVSESSTCSMHAEGRTCNSIADMPWL